MFLKSPGLASYKVVDPSIYRPKAPHYTMTGRNYPPDDTTKKPGPGAHYPEKVLIVSYLLTPNVQTPNFVAFVDSQIICVSFPR